MPSVVIAREGGWVRHDPATQGRDEGASGESATGPWDHTSRWVLWTSGPSIQKFLFISACTSPAPPQSFNPQKEVFRALKPVAPPERVVMGHPVDCQIQSSQTKTHGARQGRRERSNHPHTQYRTHAYKTTDSRPQRREVAN